MLRNIRIIEPALHQLELNLNQINNALRDRNSLNFNVLNHALAVALGNKWPSVVIIILEITNFILF